MFQSSKRRTKSSDKPICNKCLHNSTCTIKPIEGWRYVLDYCQEFKQKLTKQ